MAVAPANLGYNLLNPLFIISFEASLFGSLLKSFSIGYISLNPIRPPNDSAIISVAVLIFLPSFLNSFIELAWSETPAPKAIPKPVRPAYLSNLSKTAGEKAFCDRRAVVANLGAPKVAKLPIPLPTLLVNKSPYFLSAEISVFFLKSSCKLCNPCVIKLSLPASKKEDIPVADVKVVSTTPFGIFLKA